MCSLTWVVGRNQITRQWCSQDIPGGWVLKRNSYLTSEIWNVNIALFFNKKTFKSLFLFGKSPFLYIFGEVESPICIKTMCQKQGPWWDGPKALHRDGYTGAERQADQAVRHAEPLKGNRCNRWIRESWCHDRSMFKPKHKNVYCIIYSIHTYLQRCTWPRHC